MSVDISVILPCYNSAPLIEHRVREFESVLQSTRWTWEILLCDDGSRDDSAAIAARLAAQSSKRRFLPSAINRGRGRNVADGILASRGRIVGFADLDSSTAALYLVAAVQAIESGFAVAEANRSYKIVLSDLPFMGHRLLAHVGYAQLVRWLLGIHGHDTETGFKFFQRETALRLLAETQHPGWFWDTEIIANAHRLNCPVAEIRSLFIRHKGMASTVRFFRDSWRQGQSLVRFAWRHRKQSLRGRCCEP